MGFIFALPCSYSKGRHLSMRRMPRKGRSFEESQRTVNIQTSIGSQVREFATTFWGGLDVDLWL